MKMQVLALSVTRWLPVCIALGAVGCTTVPQQTAQPSGTPKATVEADIAAVDSEVTINPYDRAVLAATDPLSPTRLVLVSRYGHEKTVAYLLEKGVDVNARDKFGNTPLIAAAGSGHAGVVKMLVGAGADINAQNTESQTALMAAATGGRAEIVEALLKSGAQVDPVNNIGETALFSAVRFGQLDSAKLLLSRKANPNLQNQAKIASSISGYTPLMYAAERGINPAATDWEAMIRLLLENGADPNMKNRRGDSALSIARRIRHQEAIALLENAGAREERSYTSLSDDDALVKAAQLGDMPKLRHLIESGADVNMPNRLGVTPLLAAAFDGRLEAVRALLERGAKVNVVPDGLREWAASASRAPMGQHNIMESASRGDTPLLIATRRGHTEVVRFLLAQQANPLLANNLAETSLFVAAEAGHTGIVELLLKKGVNPNSFEAETLSAAFVNKMRNTGLNTPLIRAAQGGHTETAAVLLKGGAQPNVQGVMGRTALLWAVERGFAGTVELLLRSGADSNLRDIEGLAPLIVAARNGNAKIARALLTSKADVNVMENADSAANKSNIFGASGITPLIYASRAGHNEIVRMLIEAGVDVNVMSTSGVSAMKEAKDNGYQEIVQQLKVAGAQ